MRMLFGGREHRLRFCVYVWTGENDSNTLRVDANFSKTRKKPPFSKISTYVWTGSKVAEVSPNMWRKICGKITRFVFCFNVFAKPSDCISGYLFDKNFD